MLIRKELLLERITFHLSMLSTQADLLGKLHFFNLNIVAEDFYQRLLNQVYGYQLKNLNHTQANAASIDLGDPVNKLAVQVTTQRNASKIQSTLDKFAKHGLGSTYSHLKIVIIGKRTGAYKTVKIPAGMSFDGQHDVIDNQSLIKEISKKTTQELQTILDVIESELSHDTRALSVVNLTDEQSLLELRNFMDRAALQDPWDREASYLTFQTTLTELIGLINTGKKSGDLCIKPRFKYNDQMISKQLELTYNQLRTLRQLFQFHVRTGEINLSANTCSFHRAESKEAFDAQRNAIISHFNSLIAPFNYAPLPLIT